MDIAPTIYDISRDETRPATQDDIDSMMKIIMAMRVRRDPEAPLDGPARKWDFQLAIYPNPMRVDGVFIAEAKAIEPYEPPIQDYYPAVPKTPYVLSQEVEPDFAREIVRRWNNRGHYR